MDISLTACSRKHPSEVQTPFLILQKKLSDQLWAGEGIWHKAEGSAVWRQTRVGAGLGFPAYWVLW